MKTKWFIFNSYAMMVVEINGNLCDIFDKQSLDILIILVSIHFAIQHTNPYQLKLHKPWWELKEKREKRKEKREKKKEGFRSVQCKGEKGRNTKQNKNKTKTKIKPMNFTTIYYYRSGGSIKTKKKRELPVQKTEKEREKTRWLFGAFEKLLSNILGTTRRETAAHFRNTRSQEIIQQ